MQLALIGGIGMALESDENKKGLTKSKQYTPFLADPTDFLIVQHDALNNPNLNLEVVVEECLHLGDYTNGRAVVPVCEGDLFMLPESGDLIFTHQNLGEVTKEDFKSKRGAGKAAYFTEILERYSLFPSEGLAVPVLCIELKYPTSAEAIGKVHAELSKAGMGAEQVYFDSFFGSKLDLIEGCYAKSWHLMVKLWSAAIPASRVPNNGYDLVTVPRAMAFGEASEPTIYGAVGSVEEIQRAAENPLVLGVYARIKEGNSVKMFMRSINR